MLLCILLLSMLSQAYNIITENGVSGPGNVREVVYVLNKNKKRFIFHIMETVKLPGSKDYETQMSMHSDNQNGDISLAQ